MFKRLILNTNRDVCFNSIMLCMDVSVMNLNLLLKVVLYAQYYVILYYDTIMASVKHKGL